MVQVIGFDPAGDERAHEGAQGLGIVVDTLEENRLTDQWDAGIDEPRARSLRRGRQLARMIGVHGDPDRLIRALERRYKLI